ncbi:MAG: histidine phosphatase family protein [Candidatus Binataceae bacterium]
MHRPRRTLILVRHGETEGNSSIRYYGRTDIGLSDLGRAQMRAVRTELQKRFATLNSACVFSSPLIRALQSARIIAGEHQAITTIEEFRELDFGLFEGLTADEIRTRYPHEYECWTNERYSAEYTFPDGDNRAAFAARVNEGFQRMLDSWERLPGSRAVLVAHRGVIASIIRRLTGDAPAVRLASVHILIEDSQWRPEALDVIDHLAKHS